MSDDIFKANIVNSLGWGGVRYKCEGGKLNARNGPRVSMPY